MESIETNQKEKELIVNFFFSETFQTQTQRERSAPIQSDVIEDSIEKIGEMLEYMAEKFEVIGWHYSWWIKEELLFLKLSKKFEFFSNGTY